VTANAWFPRTTSGTNTWSQRQIGSAQQDFAATYSIFNPVQADFQSLYDISLSNIWATITINATIVLIAERPFTATYTVLNSVSQDFTAQYFVDGAPVTGTIPVERDFTAAYAITDELAIFEVYQDFIALWTSAGVVYQDFIGEYQVLGDTAAPGWTETETTDETWTAVSTPVDTWTPVTNPTGSWN
jgi:hypothetical protein